MNDLTRASLLIRIRDPRDADAWREFDTIYRPMLMRFALARKLGAPEAEDVAQHVMAAVHEHIGSFDYDPGKGRFKGWLRTIVNNRVRALLGRRREALADSGEFQVEQEREPSPDEEFDRIWLEEHLRHAVERVRREVEESTYQAFRAHVLDGRSVEQTCAEFGMNPNQVYRIKFRVMQKLREQLRMLDESID
ncbi:MAG: sigma-70 family RNA polymerase sigma factor [Phycisphaerae bacterium]|jgi:RNA polymerase sigma-70 factor (ECF subfamily)